MAGSTRYIRFILLAFVAIIILFLIGSSSPVVEDRVKSAASEISELLNRQMEVWKNMNLKGNLKGWSPSSFGQDEPKDNPPQKHTTQDTILEERPSGYTLPKETDSPADGSTSPNPDAPKQEYVDQKTLVNKAPGQRMNATFVTLARNSDVWDISRSIRQIEDRFNRFYNYDWVFLNDADFDETFIKVTSRLSSGRTRYGKIGEEHWGFPDFIDQDKAAQVRQEMHEKKIIYGDSISYRHMCRYESGFFYRHPLMLEYDYYWRVEPSIELFCDVGYDPFKFMRENNKKYSFVLSLYEYVETIPTLWDSVKGFMQKFPQHIAEDNSMPWISPDGGETYNHCHFWSNFEIGDLNWLRSQAYTDYFDHLDHDGGFFYERWGDAPVHSIAAAIMLPKDQIHFFNDIAYYHVPFTHCPTGEQTRLELKCHCNPQDNFDWNGYSCKFYSLHRSPMNTLLTNL
jgi:alpha 1,2-mannosyltransferase